MLGGNSAPTRLDEQGQHRPKRGWWCWLEGGPPKTVLAGLPYARFSKPRTVGPVEYDSSTALIVVDVQNDFADPNGSLYVTGGDASVDFVNIQISSARAAGALIAYTQDWHPPATPHFVTDGGIWPVHCVADTWGAEFHPRLTRDDDSITIHKGVGGEDGYSGFSVRDPQTGEQGSTGLADELRHHDIGKVVIVGLALDYCVKETALDAAGLGLATTVLADGTRPVNLSPGDGARAAAAITQAGAAII